MGPRTDAHVAPPQKSFLNFEIATDLDDQNADIAVLGLPFGDPYRRSEASNDQSNAPGAVRRATPAPSDILERWDFDFGNTLFGGNSVRAVDCGDVIAGTDDPRSHYALAEETVRAIRSAGALPLIIGGDHGIPIPVLRSYDQEGPIHVIQIDAHLDWVDEKLGVREGYSSPMRRASEMTHVDQLLQIGLRGAGSARREEYEAALDYGAHLITIEQVHKGEIRSLLDLLPDDGRYYLTIDADGLDPSVMPAVAGPAPGGLTYLQCCDVMRGLAAKGTLVGMDICEITPARDLNDISSITAGRLMINMIALATQASGR